jgi:hypothetical protein
MKLPILPGQIEDPSSQLEEIFDRKERCHFMIVCILLLRTGMQTQTTALRASLLCGYQPLNKATCCAVGCLGARYCGSRKPRR